MTNVSFLPPALRCPGSTNDLHVIDEIQATSSGSSTSGLRFIFTARLPAGIFWQVLKPMSVMGSDVEGPVALEGAAVVGVVAAPRAGAAHEGHESRRPGP